VSGAQVGVIGGSGFYQMQDLADVEELHVDTPYGPTSDDMVVGTLEGVRVAFLSRHGVGHRILPMEVPYRANIWAMKSIGVERIVAINAVGSMREAMAPGHLVIPDQFIDRTHRVDTFFGRGLVAHVSFDQPVCSQLSDLLEGSARTTETTTHRGGTYVAVEGPAFSTKAETKLYRSWDASIIGMTALPEARLAREAEICYATLAFVTDYDTWHEDHEPVSADAIIRMIIQTVEIARNVIRGVLRSLPDERQCACGDALAKALITSADNVPVEVKRDLAPIISRYMPVTVSA
jgi:5'-methylthioadenosine phosphorylase